MTQEAKVQPILRVDTLLKTQPSQLIRSWQYQNRLSRHESLSALETGLTRHILQHPSAREYSYPSAGENTLHAKAALISQQPRSWK